VGLSYPGGVVSSVGGFGFSAVCSLTDSIESGGIAVAPETCRAWNATFLANQKANEGVTPYFTSPANTANGPECTALGSWVTPNPLPYFIQISG
jgi:hypothetical protein